MPDDGHTVVDLTRIDSSHYRFRLKSWRERWAGLRGREITLPRDRMGAVLKIEPGRGGGGGEYARPEDGGPRVYSGTWTVPPGVRSATIQVIGGGGGASSLEGSGGAGGGYHEPGGRSADSVIAERQAALETERDLVEKAVRRLLAWSGDTPDWQHVQDAAAYWRENFGALGGDEYAEGAGEVLKILAGLVPATEGGENICSS
jgi:hypothetical protein